MVTKRLSPEARAVRDAEILAARRRGDKMVEIAARHDLTEMRVYQIITGHDRKRHEKRLARKAALVPA